jgi:hypothetical protein
MMHPRMVVSALAAVALAACGDGTGPDSRAQVRFANATGDVASVDFQVGNQQGATGVAMGAPSAQCLTTNAGDPLFQARAAGSTNVVAEGRPSPAMAPGSRHTAFAVGSDNEFGRKVIVVNDGHITPGEGRARVRVITAVPVPLADTLDTSEVNQRPVRIHIVDVGAPLGTTPFTNYQFGGVTNFVARDAGPVEIRIQRHIAPLTYLFTSDPINLPSNSVSTIIVGQGDTPGTFRTHVIQYSPC